MELMKSVKAIVVGSVFIGVSVLVLQLAVLFIMVGYKILAKDYPFLNAIDSNIYRFFLGIPVFILLMFAGGYITAAVGKVSVLQNSLIVGVITSALMMLMALENAILTITGFVLIVLMIGATVLGGLYWKKRHL